MTDSVQRWIETLPRRWAIGGAAIGLVWIVAVWAVGRATPSLAGFAIQTGVFVIPFAVLGFAWGWNERLALREAAADGVDGIERRLADEYHFAQGGRGAACGVAYALIFFAVETVGLIPVRDDGSVFWLIPGMALIGFGIGVAVGNVARVNLRRRLKRKPSVVDPPTPPHALGPGQPT